MLEPEPKTLDAWSRSLNIDYRGTTALVQTCLAVALKLLE